MVMHLPLHLSEEEIRSLIVPFGELSKWNLLREATGESKGTYVFRYAEDKMTSSAVANLNGLQIGEAKLHVQRVPPQMIDTLLAPFLPPWKAPVS